MPTGRGVNAASEEAGVVVGETAGGAGAGGGRGIDYARAFARRLAVVMALLSPNDNMERCQAHVIGYEEHGSSRSSLALGK